MKTALVLSAGGMWAAWEAGVWKSLCPRFTPDLIIGASAGSWNGWAMAAGCTAAELCDEWMNPRTGGIIRFGLHTTGILRPEGLEQEARRLYDRFRPRTQFALTLVEVPRMKLHLVPADKVTWRHLAAACAIPFGFPPVEIEGRRYVDGGFLGGLPLWAAEAMDATHAVALNVLTTLPFRIARKLLWVRQPAASFRVTRIEPSEPLGSLRDALVWSPVNVRRWIELGVRDGNRAATSITM